MAQLVNDEVVPVDLGAHGGLDRVTNVGTVLQVARGSDADSSTLVEDERTPPLALTTAIDDDAVPPTRHFVTPGAVQEALHLAPDRATTEADIADLYGFAKMCALPRGRAGAKAALALKNLEVRTKNEIGCHDAGIETL